MVLEATIIILDNSKYAVNGDIIPSRFDAQTDALNLIATSKMDDNLESGVGLMTMGGRNVEVLLTPVQDKNTIMACINKIEVYGDSNLSRAIQIATLSLKHRANKNQRQRIIAMVASPLQESAKELEAIGKKLKKNQISIDIINLGEPGNVEKLNILVGATNSEDNSHFINVEPSITLLADILSSSAIVGRGMGEMSTLEFTKDQMGGAGDMDDDLQVAIRISLEEEQRRIAEQQRLAAGNNAGPSTAGGPGSEAERPQGSQAEKREPEPTELEKDLLRKAKEMSINPKGGEDPHGDAAKLALDTDLIKDVLKDLNVDPEGKEGKEFLEEMTSEADRKKREEEEKKKKQQQGDKMDEEKK